MPLKRKIQSDHMPVNNYEMVVPGLPPILFTKIDGLDEELEHTDLPDRTTASGGNTKVVEFTAHQLLHHTAEVAAIERWYNSSKHPVQFGYKKNITLMYFSISDTRWRTYSLMGAFPTKRKLPNLEMNNEGDAAICEWTFRCDEVVFQA